MSRTAMPDPGLDVHVQWFEQFRVEHEEVVVRLDHRGPGAGRLQLLGDPLGICGAAGIGEAPPTDVTRHVGDKTGNGEIESSDSTSDSGSPVAGQGARPHRSATSWIAGAPA